MSELKFRHWGGKYGMKYFTFRDVTMTFDHYEGQKPSLAHVIHEVADEPNGFPQCIDCDHNGHDVMLSTGLKDRDGKEIYENDLLKSNNGRVWLVKHGHWEMPWPGVKPFEYYGWYAEGNGNQISLDCDCEIIGNLYENPELLK